MHYWIQAPVGIGLRRHERVYYSFLSRREPIKELWREWSSLIIYG